MNLTQTSNPFFGKSTFQKAAFGAVGEEVMTLRGALNKTALVLLLVFASAFFTWQKFFDAWVPGNPGSAFSAVSLYLLLGGIGGFIIALIASFSPRRSGFFTPLYAILEGMFLGGLSAMFEAQFPGLVIRAVALTFAVFLGMLLIYRQRIIRVTGKFRRGMVAAIFGIMLVYLVGWIAHLFGANWSFLHGGGTFGLLFSLIVTGISAFSLLLDFDFIERGAQSGAPKYMEWYSVFGLLVSLVWLYVNILRLLSVFANRE
ncbi:MAG TPA: Bax inhibitor-1/YccA family protein [Prolixibacteraceae bacterium]|nr:Bax inhibitor-1/YccA family protein [Prolixibacteraceae bacterium]